MMLSSCTAQPLRQAGIPAQMNYREGDIVLPMPYPRWGRLLSLDIVREVTRRQRSVPVTTVNPQGMPERSWQN